MGDSDFVLCIQVKKLTLDVPNPLGGPSPSLPPSPPSDKHEDKLIKWLNVGNIDIQYHHHHHLVLKLSSRSSSSPSSPSSFYWPPPQILRKIAIWIFKAKTCITSAHNPIQNFGNINDLNMKMIISTGLALRIWEILLALSNCPFIPPFFKYGIILINSKIWKCISREEEWEDDTNLQAPQWLFTNTEDHSCKISKNRQKSLFWWNTLKGS